ncbi:hypothetical protein BGLT_01148 [Caballeronia glathei]|jgi:hypothetical protein|uniref:hypothetical protein n=1 Tax=Caballeronia glathei TaxID=60547 RepID=UPI00050872A6|nr:MULTISPECIES: hypothetical protein [Burkholderiaceae]TCK38145.1 hypothetical protein B0G84_3448 [Paraburkholderia sp. BL8N3]CDY78277.1 hypothetical protein BGLT_01148 [Caballeronia glathei]
MYHTREVTSQPAAAVAAAASCQPVRVARRSRSIQTVVTLDLTVPGLNSNGPRRELQDALGEAVRVYVVSTDRRHDCITLHVEVAGQTLDTVIGALAANLTQATLGRAKTISVRR